jgi:hypothetical protein
MLKVTVSISVAILMILIGLSVSSITCSNNPRLGTAEAANTNIMPDYGCSIIILEGHKYVVCKFSTGIAVCPAQE